MIRAHRGATLYCRTARVSPFVGGEQGRFSARLAAHSPPTSCPQGGGFAALHERAHSCGAVRVGPSRHDPALLAIKLGARPQGGDNLVAALRAGASST